MSDPKRDLLRHTVATIAYRGGKAVRGAPDSFATFRAERTSRMPAQVLAHIGDLFDWALWLVRGQHVWRESPPLPWPQEVERFFRSLSLFDAYLASDDPLGSSPEKIMQGPLADALTHVGQLTMLRRLAGSPVRGENYFKADIAPGRVGPEQSGPLLEFD